ncbi:MAG: tyrosine-type recombinase/integrase [Terracidiphilus sp.]
MAEVDDSIKTGPFAYATKAVKAAALRRILRALWIEHGAPKLDGMVRRYPDVRPRNVTATNAEVAAILAAAPPPLRLWLLLCSDLAMRSGTAARIAPEHYNPRRGELRFVTKHNARLTLPVTAQVRHLLACCNLEDSRTFVHQLWTQQPTHRGQPVQVASEHTLRTQYRALLKKLAITRRITPHDLRRTTAVAMLNATHDVRDVQALLGHRNLHSTLWYLDHDAVPVNRATLELIKNPTQEKIA